MSWPRSSRSVCSCVPTSSGGDDDDDNKADQRPVAARAPAVSWVARAWPGERRGQSSAGGTPAGGDPGTGGAPEGGMMGAGGASMGERGGRRARGWRNGCGRVRRGDGHWRALQR